MDYLKKFVSNTTAASGNQDIFTMEKGEIRTARAYYKIFAGGKYNYSLLFSNIIDSTYDDELISYKNMLCEPWRIHSAKLGQCKNSDVTAAIEKWWDITFDGNTSKSVAPGEFFTTDPVELEFEKDEYLCVEMTFSGTKLPQHVEMPVPTYIKEGNQWIESTLMPLPGMIGCDRKVKKTVAFWGDSITQGVGAECDSYDHWVAKLAEKLGEDYAVWDIGIGYARAKDAATLGAWYYKAKHCDVVGICFGVNDIFHEPEDAVGIGKNIEKLVDRLKNDGVKVILQSVPPFDYEEPKRTKWYELNKYIKEVVAPKADGFFENTGFLGVEEKPYKTIYGGHPNAEGCEVWANTFYPVMKEFLENL